MTATPLEARVSSLLRRAADAEAFSAWEARAKATGWCRHPVRLRGMTTQVDPASGEVLGRFSSDDQPDGVLLKACGQRRATVCQPCSATYRGDAFQLVAAGLRGGKGVPEKVSTHPTVFATFTAPSFGPVHSRREDHGWPQSCRPGAQVRCPHGRWRQCEVIHAQDDPLLGQPLCPDCFDYPKAVLWNALAGELWRRTTIGVVRHLASLLGFSRSAVRERVRLSFAKVVEYQARGVVHLHMVARLDGAGGRAEKPAEPFTPNLLVSALHQAAISASVPHPAGSGLLGEVRWGRQVHLHVVGNGDGPVPGAVAAYLAKYATKSTDPAGMLDHRLRPSDLDYLDDRLNPHLGQMVRTAWYLGGRPELEQLRLRAWAHTLGFRGHWLTKSREYSSTFAALRAVRHQWNIERAAEQRTGDTVAVGQWRYAGRGWTNAGDDWLAETAARESASLRRTARLDRVDRRSEIR